MILKMKHLAGEDKTSLCSFCEGLFLYEGIEGR